MRDDAVRAVYQSINGDFPPDLDQLSELYGKLIAFKRDVDTALKASRVELDTRLAPKSKRWITRHPKAVLEFLADAADIDTGAVGRPGALEVFSGWVSDVFWLRRVDVDALQAVARRVGFEPQLVVDSLLEEG